MNSIWQDSINIKEFPTLNGNKKTDVLIVGGGIAGILCAYLLKQNGVDYILVEADRICSGITKNTTAKITSQHGLIYDKLIKSYSSETARKYYDINQLALKKFKDIIKEKNINCNYNESTSYVYSTNNRKKIENEVKALNRLKIKSDFTNDTELPFKVAGAVKTYNQAHFHPLKFLKEISKDLKIYENTFVESIWDKVATTRHGKIKAENIIITTHFPFIDLHGFYFLKMYQSRSYVIALSNAAKLNGIYIDEKANGMSFRPFEDYLLIGGGDHRTGKTGGGYNELRQFAKKYYKDSTEKYNYATQDCMSLDGIPYIGKYSALTHNLYVATGFNKWGMTSSMVSAMLLTDMLLDKKNEYSYLFSPSRTILKPQLLVNTTEAVLNLLTPTSKRCSHMGCALKWNKLEKTWDCPCHGSRFNRDGSIIDNPAIRRI